MQNTQESKLKEQSESMLKIFEKAKTDLTLREELQKDPLAVLNKIGIDVEDTFKQIVSRQLESLARFGFSDQLPTNAEIKTSVLTETPADFTFSANGWGVVLTCNETATQKIENGLNVVAAISAAVAASAAYLSAAEISFIAACFSAFCWGYASTIGLVDQGNGVYLTITWIQIAITMANPALGPASLTPIPTAVTN